MSLLTRLHTYRATEQRTPTEDFLSEAFVEWLRLAGNAGLMSRVLRELLRLPPDRCLPTGTDGRDIHWSTQYVIGPGFRASGKRPDIVGQMEGFFLIIENKIGAGFTRYDETDGTVNQLELYADYQRKQERSCGGIVLVTHYTDAPVGWNEPIVTWAEIHRWLSGLTLPGTPDPYAVLNFWTQHLIAFLEDNGMTGIRISLSDIIVYPAYKRLCDGMGGLGKLAKDELRNLNTDEVWRGLKVPHGTTSGGFNQPAFFGAIKTPAGVKADEASFVLWCGVLASNAYQVIPHLDDIPELSVGFGVWTARSISEDDQTCGSLKKKLEEMFRSDTPNMVWNVELKQVDGGGLFLVQARYSLIELYQQSGGDFWDSHASSFFKTACQKIINIPNEDWKIIKSLHPK